MTSVRLRLQTRAPFAGEHLLAFLGARAVPGVEAAEGRAFRRTLALAHGPAWIEVRLPDSGPARLPSAGQAAAAGHVDALLHLADPADEPQAVLACRRLLDLDADPAPIAAALGGDPLLGPLVRRVPGLRAPGAVDLAEVAVRAVAGQQVSVAAARTVLGRVARRYGERVDGGHLFPTPDRLAAADPADLPMPRRRGATIVALSRALASERGIPPDLTELPGIGPWTAAYVAMRTGNPDVLLTGDRAIRRALERLGADPALLAPGSERWRPWRTYATHHLWASLPAGEPRSG